MPSNITGCSGYILGWLEGFHSVLLDNILCVCRLRQPWQAAYPGQEFQPWQCMRSLPESCVYLTLPTAPISKLAMQVGNAASAYGAEEALAQAQLVDLPQNGGLVLPLAAHGFLVGLLVIEGISAQATLPGQATATAPGLHQDMSLQPAVAGPHNE